MEPEPLAPVSPVRRYVEVLLFVAGWMACGWALHLDVTTYLLLGVPLTVLFQRFARRRPLRALWVRDAPAFRLGRAGIAIAAALSVIPLLGLIGSLADADWAGAVTGTCSLVGAVGATYALVHFPRRFLRPLVYCLLITTALDAIQWTLFFAFNLVELRPVEWGLMVRLVVLVYSLLQYIAITFAIEEVTFRMLDDHLHQGRRDLGVLSAVILSALWGLWHLPVAEELSWQAVGILLYVHVPYGVCLSLFWRRTGNLFIPALAHSLGDAIRNALMLSD
jgi:membrane protease YdiL (CAAX protease family)